jgi:hypothetical protein
LNNAVGGSTNNILTLTQSATGGNGGYGSYNTGTSSAGAAGNATSTLILADTEANTVVANVNATGGFGGDGEGINGADGGNATVTAYVTGIFNVTINATATGGTGGFSQPAGGQPAANYGNAGNASLGTVYGSTSGGGTVAVAGTVIGGSGLNGQAVLLDNAVDGDATSTIDLTQTATGGIRLLLRRNSGGGFECLELYEDRLRAAPYCQRDRWRRRQRQRPLHRRRSSRHCEFPGHQQRRPRLRANQRRGRRGRRKCYAI